MDDSSTDVLNDIDALLNKLKHLPEGSRRDVLSSLQARLQTEVPTDNPEPTPTPSASAVTLPSKDDASTIKKSKAKETTAENQPAEKEVYVVHLQQKDDAVINNKDQDVIHILSVESLAEKGASAKKLKRKSPRKKNVNKKASIEEEEEKSPQRRVLTLPSRYNNYSGVPTFLKSPKREPSDDSGRSIRERKNKPKEIIQECQIVLTKIDEGVPLPTAKADDGSQIEDATFGAKILLAAAERNELEDLNGSTEVKKIKVEVDGAQPHQKRRRRKRCTREDKTCPICERVYVNACYLRIHMRKHTGEKPFQCERCGKNFSQKSSLWVHMKRHDGKYDHQCPHCDYKSVLKIDLDRHMPKHTGAKIYICELCGKMFTTDMRLKDHIRHVHERKEKHICDKCGFFTHRPDNLRRHLAVKHSDDEFFKCPICGDVLKQRWTFIVHLRRHTGERPHVCSECQKGFKSLSQLAVHRRTHKEGEFHCPDCKRMFKTKYHLIRHSVIHSGEKPFACQHCPYTCNVKGNINKHMKTVHKLSNFSFRRLKRLEGTMTPALNTVESEKSAIERGEQVTQDFLNRISLRKDENLTVEKLQQMITKETDIVDEEPVTIKPARRRATYGKKLSSVTTQRAAAAPGKFHTYNLTDKKDGELPATVLHDVSEIDQKVELLDLGCTDQDGRTITSYCNGYPITCVIASDANDAEVPVTPKENSSIMEADEKCGDVLLFSVKECLGEQVTTIESADGAGIINLPMQVQDVCMSQNNDSASSSTICYVIQVAP